MNFRSAILCAFVAMLPIASVGAQDAQKININTIQEKPAFCFDAAIILDPEILLENKRKEIAGLQLSADSGDAQSQYLLGSFYRLGEKHPAKIFIRDIDKAKIYLGNAAIGGNYSAMAGMAELELSKKNYRDAVFWAQIFVHYSEVERLKYNMPSEHAYQAYLLQRVIQLPKKDKDLYTEKMLLDDLANFHANHNPKILGKQSVKSKEADVLKYSVCKDKNKNEPLGQLQIISGSSIDAGQLTAQKMPTPGYAYYLLLIDSKGIVVRTLVVDSMPDTTYAKALAYVAKRIRFNEAKGASIRATYIPLSFDDQSIKIKKNGTKK